MRRLLAVCAVALATTTSFQASADEPVRVPALPLNVFATALVFGPVDGDAAPPLAGALVLDLDRRLLLTRSRGVSDKPSVVFPAYSDDKLMTDPANYLALWKRPERWNAEVLHRDRDRDLAVIRLEGYLPSLTATAELAPRAPDAGTTVRALTTLRPPGKAARYWETVEGKVVTAGKARPAGVATDTALTDSDPVWALVDANGSVVAVNGSPRKGGRPGEPATTWLDVADVRAFLTDKKVPFRRTAADSPLRLTLAAKAPAIKTGQAPVLVLTVKNEGDRSERLHNGNKAHLQRVWFHLIVWRDGKPVPLSSPLIGVPLSEPDDYVTLKPGEQTEFELSRFDVSVAKLPAGRYQVQIQFLTWPREGESIRHLSPPAEFVVER
jgi:hypothetical protein